MVTTFSIDTLERVLSGKNRKKKGPRANASGEKPYPEFPLTPHASGRWRKIHKGKAYWFGRVEDGHVAALKQYQHAWPYILAGKPVPPLSDETSPEGIVTVADVVNAFIGSKRAKLDSGEMSPRTFADTIRTGKLIVQAIDRNRDIETIGPADFAKLRDMLAEGRSLVVLGILITRCKAVFNYATKHGLRDSVVRYGDAFDTPSKKSLRLEKAKRPKRFYTADECRTLIDAAPMPLKAMILLALNAGLGNTDIGELALADIDLDAGVLSSVRPKTGVQRRAPLWDETITALREAISSRPKPTRDAEGRVFVTKYGAPWVRSKVVNLKAGGKLQPKLSLTDAVGGEFKKLIKTAGLASCGRGFYALRHTFRTVADALPDRPAVDRVMGHEADKDIRTHYVSQEEDDRLRAVVDHVRSWLFDDSAKGSNQTKNAAH